MMPCRALPSQLTVCSDPTHGHIWIDGVMLALYASCLACRASNVDLITLVSCSRRAARAATETHHVG